jgi:CheY-like chemotaxis protein
MPMKKILWIEDNLYDGALILAVLNEVNLAHTVRIAYDGQEVLDYRFHWRHFEGFAEKNPEVIILDLKMPKMDGKDVLKRIKTDKELMEIPVIVFTSSDEGKDVRECFDLGAEAYVVKPISFQAFSQTVQGLGHSWPDYLGSGPLTFEDRQAGIPLFKNLQATF